MNAAAKSIETPATQSDLRYGRRIHCILYGGKNGTIFNVHGTPDLGNSTTIQGGIGHIVTGDQASIDVVWDHGALSMQVPECIVKGVQWRFLDQPDRDQNDISEALFFAKEEQERKEAEKAAETRAFNDKVSAFRNDPEFKHYEQTPIEGGFHSVDKTKLAAKNIRKLLKKEFPGVKFSVRKESYSSIWVTWPRDVDSDTLNQRTVYDALSDFRMATYSHYNDCHGSSTSAFNVVFGGVDYMTAQPSF